MKLKSARGFSIIELAIVIGLSCILAVLALPQFVKLNGNANLKEVAQTISGDIQLCKQMAVNQTVKHRIAIDPDNNQYVIQKETSPSVWEDVSSPKKVCENYPDIKIAGVPTFPGSKIYCYTRGTTNLGTLKIQHKRLFSEASIGTKIVGRVSVEYEHL